MLFRSLATICENTKGVISGEDAFLLYDTYGFPIELTEEYAQEKNLKVDREGFNKCLEEQKNRARAARKDENSMSGQNEEYLKFKEPSTFSGYNAYSHKSRIIAKFGNGVVLDETPFFAFSGGQLSDTGNIGGIRVLDVVKMPNGQHLHILESNPFEVGQIVWAEIDAQRRELTRRNHSAAHLLQKALQEVFGEHVHQQGSQVGPEYSRFDFNNYQTPTDEEIIKVEDLVNQYIKEAHTVTTHILPIEEAKKLGAMALFGEKYGDMVRVVDMEVSKEFCAGTHVDNTSQIEKYCIYSFESIGSGIFRITAATSANAMAVLTQNVNNLVSNLNTVIKKANDLVTQAKAEQIEIFFNYTVRNIDVEGYRYILALRKEVAKAQEAMKTLEKDYQAKKSQNALKSLDKFDSLIKNNKLFTTIDVEDTNLIKDMASAVRNNKGLDIALFAYANESKVTFVCATSEKFNAVEVVKEACKVTGGGGGGKPNLAQAGGKDPSKTLEAIAHLEEVYK